MSADSQDVKPKTELKNKDNKTEKPAIYLRPAETSDVSFLFNSWLKSYWGGGNWRYKGALLREVDRDLYYQEHHRVVERLLRRCTVTIACRPEAPEDIYGYIVYEVLDGMLVVHYAYTKEFWRHLGIFKELLASAGHNPGNGVTLYTHHNNITNIMCLEHLKRRDERLRVEFIYHPYLLLNYSPDGKRFE